MIERLLNLELSGFRCFSGEEQISLDADVVLIHGANGTGKTSILSALEFGLTGQVSELAIFEDDYPRCLRNVDTSRPTFATVKFRTPQGQHVTSTHTVNGNLREESVALSTDDRRVFRDRCYLSQTSLSRLLENYQACSSEDPEQPLVRFVRELLGLDLLENITSGLYEAALMPRLEKAVPALERVAEEEKILRERLNELRNTQTTGSAEWRQALVA